MGLVKPYYKVILPKTEGDFGFQWKSCFDELSDLLRHTEIKPFRISVFLHTKNETDYHSNDLCASRYLPRKFIGRN